MSSDEQFTALGPAAIGFQTNATQIDRGAEIAGNSVGVHGSGPIGVLGSGKDDGVVGEGGSGRGGRFSSREGHAQLKLVPQTLNGDGRPRELVPMQLERAELPQRAQVGDLWMTAVDRSEMPCVLWLCVVANHGDRRARWSQLLLGDQIEGTFGPVDE